jgi:GrpB-like predicted nucleotidyltransferase (UPF0157 family)
VDEHQLQAVVAMRRQEIAGVLPEAQIYVTGSASVPSLSARDIDLVAIVPDVPDVAQTALRAIYRLYEKQWNDEWAAFRVEGPPQVDTVLTKTGTKWDAHHRLAWDLLRREPLLVAEYAGLKRDEAKKAIFFERIVRLLPHVRRFRSNGAGQQAGRSSFHVPLRDVAHMTLRSARRNSP